VRGDSNSLQILVLIESVLIFSDIFCQYIAISSDWYGSQETSSDHPSNQSIVEDSAVQQHAQELLVTALEANRNKEQLQQQIQTQLEEMTSILNNYGTKAHNTATSNTKISLEKAALLKSLEESTRAPTSSSPSNSSVKRS
jgi:hypothetical protein